MASLGSNSPDLVIRAAPCITVRSMSQREAMINLTEEQWRTVDARADRLGMTTDTFVKNAILHFSIDPVSQKPRRGQFNRIHRDAESQGHIWTEEELKERHLPLYWSEDWVRARLAEGYDLPGLALLSGFSSRVVANYLRTHFEIAFRQKINPEMIQAMRIKVAAGASREVVAAEHNITIQAIIPYCTDLPDGRTNNFIAKAGQVRTWPATTQEIADTLFDGVGNRATTWCRDMVKSGRLQRLERGLYALAQAPKPERNK